MTRGKGSRGGDEEVERGKLRRRTVREERGETGVEGNKWSGKSGEVGDY